MSISTIAAAIVIVCVTAALELQDKEYEEKRKEFENFE